MRKLGDYVLVRRGDRQGLMVTKAICDASGWTDVRHFIFKMRLRLQHSGKLQSKRPPGKLDTAFLSLPTHRLHCNNQLTRPLEDLPIENANASVGNGTPFTRPPWLSSSAHFAQHQDCSDDSNAIINNMLAKKNRQHTAYTLAVQLMQTKRPSTNLAA
ncbi:hypothetical protein SprV_0602186800 [Sparganum proliferum]